jgi:hypothetical protein
MKINSLIKVALSMPKIRRAIESASNKKNIFSEQFNRTSNLKIKANTSGFTAPAGEERLHQLRRNAQKGLDRNIIHGKNLENLLYNRKLMDSGAKGHELRGTISNTGDWIKPSKKYS